MQFAYHTLSAGTSDSFKDKKGTHAENSCSFGVSSMPVAFTIF